MGARPGDCSDEGTFSLPAHLDENLSDIQSAERICDYFASISAQYTPLNVSLLPDRVQNKLNQSDSPPQVFEHEVYQTIVRAKKSKGTVPGDLPREIIKEFAPELTTPIISIINNSFLNAQWPTMWQKYPSQKMKMT